MGTRWESVFVTITDDQLPDVAEAARELLPHVLRGELSLNVFPVRSQPNVYSLECTGFRAGPVLLRSKPSGSLGAALEQIPAGILKSSGGHAELALAALASRVIGSATWLFFSDTLGEAAGACFSQGDLVNSFQVADYQDPAYERAFLVALAEFVPGVSYVDDELFRVIYNSGAAASIPVGC